MSTELELKESSKTDAFKVFSALIDSVDAQLSKLITHQTMSFDSGSSRSQSESHERTYNELIQSDLTSASFDINDVLLPYLRSLGYNFASTDRFEWHDAEQLSTLDRSKVLQIFLQSGYKFSDEDVAEITGYKPIPTTQTPPLPPPATKQVNQKKKPLLQHPYHVGIPFYTHK